ncbi:MAG: cytochrome c [Acidobacteriaceae bacterium]|jgi:mono/diheme cytochrome c family protein
MAALLSPVSVVRAADTQPANSLRVKKGAALFQKNCILCHNKQRGDATPFGPPNLHGVLQKKLITSAQARAIIRTGRGQMPPFSSRLTESQIQDLIAFLKTQ